MMTASHPSAAGCLALAAAPCFAAMALLASMPGGDPSMICSGVHGMWKLGGMVPMYGLMSVFHLPPWLALLSRQRKPA